MSEFSSDPCSKYIDCWFQELTTCDDVYKEPILDETAMEFVKYACDKLNQDTHVFIMSADMLEKYIRKKNAENKKITDPAITIVCVIFLCSKFVGEQADLRTRHIQMFLGSMTKRSYSNNELTRHEYDIFLSLGAKLPLCTKIDELNTFLATYTKPMKLKMDIRPMCVKMLEIIYIGKQKLHHSIKKMYMQNEEAFITFKQLFANKIYLIVGIVLCAFRMTHLRNIVDLEQVLVDLSAMTSIHKDHIQFLSSIIYQYLTHRMEEEKQLVLNK